MASSIRLPNIRRIVYVAFIWRIEYLYKILQFIKPPYTVLFTHPADLGPSPRLYFPTTLTSLSRVRKPSCANPCVTSTL